MENLEIERKFLVRNLPENMNNYNRLEIEQIYISTEPVIRIRKSNEKYTLTVKGKGNISKKEFELEISGLEYEKLCAKIEEGTTPVSKTRYVIPLYNGFVAELDIYYEKLTGLRTVEVEFESLEQANEFIPPDWFGKDVTNDHSYSNSSLSKHYRKNAWLNM